MKTKFWPRALWSQAGETLTMVLVAIGLASLVSVTVASIFTDIVKSQNSQRARTEIDQFHRELMAHLMQKNACFNTFAPLGPYPNAGKAGVVNAIMDAEVAPIPPTAKFSKSVKYGGDTFTIETLNFIYRDVVPLNTDAGEIELQIGYQTVLPGVGPALLRPRSILIGTTKNTTTKALTTCVLKSVGASDDLWKVSTANAADIYYPGGKVGIGTDAPVSLLHVVETSGTNPRGVLSSQYSNDSTGAQVSLYKARGAPSAPATVQANDILGGFHFFGNNGSSYSPSAIIRAYAEQNFSTSSMGTAIGFFTTPNGSAGIVPTVTISSTNNPDNATVTVMNTIGNASLSCLKTGRRWTVGMDANDPDKFKFAYTNTIPNFATDTKFSVGSDGSVAFGGNLSLSGNLGIGAPAGANNPLVITNNTGNAAVKINSNTFNAQIRMDGLATGVTAFLGPGAFTGGASVGIGSLTGHPLGLYAGGFKAAEVPYGGSYTFVVNGVMYAAAGYAQGSDLRLKTNVIPLRDDFEKIHALRGVSYRLRALGDHSARQIGLIAQDVRDVYPEVVTENKDGMLALDYGRLIAPLIEAFKSFSTRSNQRLQSLDDRYAELKAENAELRRLVEELRAGISAARK